MGAIDRTVGRRLSWLLVAGTIISTTLSQVAMKFAAIYGHESVWRGIPWLLNPWVWFALALSGVALLFWLGALSRLPLSEAYPWTALVYVATPLASHYLFHDELTFQYFLGIGCICTGIFLSAGNVRRGT